MPEANNVDDLLVKSMNEQVQVNQEQPPQVESPNEPTNTQEDINQSIEEPEKEQQENVPHGTSDYKVDNQADKVDKESDNVDKNPIDEYGNPIEKPKMYSEEDVQRMIRDRLSRSRHEPPQQQQPNQPSANDANPANEDWEAELEKFVEKTIDKRQQKMTEKQWQAQEQAIQAEFEAKFNTGMAKYNDFQPVVKKISHNLTNEMMLATRALDNPAAFIYGAAKMHPQELERISKIQDSYQQAAEIGRLHEKMVKNRNAITQASKPLEQPKGDLPQIINKMPSLEERIVQHAKSKRR